MKEFLPVAQIVVAAVLMVLVLLQQRGTALGSAFGGEGGFYGTLRGVQKNVYWATIVFGALLIILSLLSLRIG